MLAKYGNRWVRYEGGIKRGRQRDENKKFQKGEVEELGEVSVKGAR